MVAAQRAINTADLDVVHDHLPLSYHRVKRYKPQTVLTAHRLSDSSDAPAVHPGLRLVAISRAQAALSPSVPWAGVIHHGLPLEDYPFVRRKEPFALFLGRMAPEKGCHLAIDAARTAKVRLVIAAKCTEPREHVYFENIVRPRLGSNVAWLNEATAPVRMDLLAQAQCLIFPVLHEEPFGLVVIEAQACGTPVVALDRGAVPEIIRDGVTGLVVGTPVELPDALRATSRINPLDCRSWIGERFSIDRMIDHYEATYFCSVARQLSQPVVDKGG